jgi:GMP synthase PP-ATPase subunit
MTIGRQTSTAISQAVTVLPPSGVGVMGDQRTYERVVAPSRGHRGSAPDWFRFPPEVLTGSRADRQRGAGHRR